jgi:hypothetical protein
VGGALRCSRVPRPSRTSAERLQLGLDTFGDVTIDTHGAPLPHARGLRHVLAEAALADQLGIDAIGE